MDPDIRFLEGHGPGLGSPYDLQFNKRWVEGGGQPFLARRSMPPILGIAKLHSRGLPGLEEAQAPSCRRADLTGSPGGS
jgi:hypothetical protein